MYSMQCTQCNVREFGGDGSLPIQKGRRSSTATFAVVFLDIRRKRSSLSSSEMY